ncbi:MAG: DUF2905 domain-containing protein [bacterium]
MNQIVGKIIIVAGIIAIVVGAIVWLGWGGKVFGWMGRLPGDIRIENENMRFYFPIVTSILISILLTVLSRLFFWFK